MNIKQLSIVLGLGLIFATTSSTTQASNDVRIFGLPAPEALSYFMSNSEKPFKLDLGTKSSIHMITISKNGLKAGGGTIADEETPAQIVLRAFNLNPPQLKGGELTMTCRELNMGGGCLGRKGITLTAGSFIISPFTVWATNGNVALKFSNPNSLITSVTLPESAIKSKLDNDDLKIGAIWGTFDGVPSDGEQTIYLVGYPSIEVSINPKAIIELLKK